MNAVAAVIRSCRNRYQLTPDGSILMDWDDALREADRLREAGVSDEAVSVLTGLTPLQRYKFDASPRRQRDLEAIARQAMNLAVMLRDEDPQLVWDCLCRLDEHQVRELAAVALAAMPVDRPLSEAFGWLA